MDLVKDPATIARSKTEKQMQRGALTRLHYMTPKLPSIKLRNSDRNSCGYCCRIA